MPNKTITLVPVTAANFIQTASVPRGDGTFNVTTQYWVMDDQGNKYKQGIYNFVLSDTGQTLLQIITTTVAGINAQEGMA